MKKDGSILYLILVFSLVNLIALLFSSQDNRHSRQQAAAEQKSRSLPKPAVTTDVYLPSAMTFAGETVPLHRLDVREALQKELIVNTYLHSHTIQLLKNAPRIFAVIEPILKEAGIPDDFKYLAVIESNLNPSAVSPAKAVGLWQFMEGTGREYGLEINKEVDERYHIQNQPKPPHATYRKPTTVSAPGQPGPLHTMRERPCCSPKWPFRKNRTITTCSSEKKPNATYSASWR